MNTLKKMLELKSNENHYTVKVFRYAFLIYIREGGKLPHKGEIEDMDTKAYKNLPLWEQKDNDSTYYDRELDLQGEVPGRSLEEAKEAFRKKYGVKGISL